MNTRLQTNVLAPLLMTLLLSPLLKQTALLNAGGKPKVIFTGSDAHIAADPALITSALASSRSIIQAFNDEKKYINGKRYFQSKVGPIYTFFCSPRHIPTG